MKEERKYVLKEKTRLAARRSIISAARKQSSVTSPESESHCVAVSFDHPVGSDYPAAMILRARKLPEERTRRALGARDARRHRQEQNVSSSSSFSVLRWHTVRSQRFTPLSPARYLAETQQGKPCCRALGAVPRQPAGRTQSSRHIRKHCVVREMYCLAFDTERRKKCRYVLQCTRVQNVPTKRKCYSDGEKHGN